MKLPSSFRRFLRKMSRYVGPVSASTVLRGCPCPAPVTVPDQPYTASLAVDADSTVDANPASWKTWCSETCGDMFTECYVHVYTSEGNSLPASIACDVQYGENAISAATAPWVNACKKACGEEQDCLIGLESSNNVMPTIQCKSWWIDCAGGRSTDGVVVEQAPMNSHWLARMATLEAEAVPAFRRLAHELAALGAPRKLRRRAARSRRDESRHARVMTSLARRHGSNPAAVQNPEKPLSLRPLEEVALENAIEGCIRETYGAWNALQRAKTAPSAELRATMRRIARDEMRHAQLAWDIHEWALKRLDAHERQRITGAMQDAWNDLTHHVDDARTLGEMVQLLDPADVSQRHD